MSCNYIMSLILCLLYHHVVYAKGPSREMAFLQIFGFGCAWPFSRSKFLWSKATCRSLLMFCLFFATLCQPDFCLRSWRVRTLSRYPVVILKLQLPSCEWTWQRILLRPWFFWLVGSKFCLSDLGRNSVDECLVNEVDQADCRIVDWQILTLLRMWFTGKQSMIY